MENLRNFCIVDIVKCLLNVNFERNYGIIIFWLYGNSLNERCSCEYEDWVDFLRVESCFINGRMYGRGWIGCFVCIFLRLVFINY